MDEYRKWHLAWAKLDAFSKDLPTSILEKHVTEFHGILDLLREASGEDVSDDFGVHWKHMDALDLNAGFVLNDQNGWAVGAKGTIARLVNRKQYLIRNDSPKDDSLLAFTSSLK